MATCRSAAQGSDASHRVARPRIATATLPSAQPVLGACVVISRGRVHLQAFQ